MQTKSMELIVKKWNLSKLFRIWIRINPVIISNLEGENVKKNVKMLLETKK